MTFLKKALGAALSLQVALLAPATAVAQTAERAPIMPAAPMTLAVPLSLPVLPALSQQALAPQLVPSLAIPAAPAAKAQAAAPLARAALAHVSQAARPSAPGASAPAQDAARLDGFWSGRRSAATAAAAVVAAPRALGWVSSALGPARAYVAAGGVLAGTYAAHRVVRWSIDHVAAKRHWDPNTRDTARFIGLLATWTLGAAVGLHLAHVATAKLVATIGLALTFAVKDSVSNVLQAVLFLVRRPFLLGEKIRIGENLYVVDNMEAQYVTLRRLAKLVEDKPDAVPSGFVVVPMAQVDPLGRAVDEKGRKFALVRAPLRPDGEPRAEYVRYNYTLLAGKAFTLFRPYVDHATGARLSRLPAELRPRSWRVPVRQIFDAFRQTPRKTLLTTALWLGLAIAAAPLWPVLQAHATLWGVQLLWPWLQGGLTLWATRAVWKLADEVLPLLASRLGWRQQTLVAVKLLVQSGIFLAGTGLALRAMQFDWQAMMTSLGVTAAAAAWASGDILTNLSTGLMLRMTRPFNINEHLGVGSDYSGLVQEMNPFHVVLKPAEGMHTLVPYSAISGNELRTLESDPGAQP